MRGTWPRRGCPRRSGSSALGLDIVTVAGSYHAGKFLRPHGTSGRSVFRKTALSTSAPARAGMVRSSRGQTPFRPSAMFFVSWRKRRYRHKCLARAAAQHGLGAAHPDCTVRRRPILVQPVSVGARSAVLCSSGAPGGRELLRPACPDHTSRSTTGATCGRPTSPGSPTQ